MRRISLILEVLSIVSLLIGLVSGYASAPGTYPEEETRAGNDVEMPKNPYQNGWTGYDFYYEKEPKNAPVPSGSGKMPAFQSIESVSTDRENPEDPGNTAYQASGSESGPSKHKTSTAPTTSTPSISSKDLSEKVMVSPSSSTKDPIPTSTIKVTNIPTTSTYFTTPISVSTATIIPTTQMSTIETHAPIAPEHDPESGSDQSAAENLELLYGGGVPDSEKKDVTPTPITLNKAAPLSHDPPPPQPPKNLLTTLIEKKVMKPKTETGNFYENIGGPSGYESKGLEKKPNDLSTDSHESGYGPGSNSKSSKWAEEGSYDSKDLKSRGQAPGSEPKVFTPTVVVPSLDYGQSSQNHYLPTFLKKTDRPMESSDAPKNYDHHDNRSGYYLTNDINQPRSTSATNQNSFKSGYQNPEILNTPLPENGKSLKYPAVSTTTNPYTVPTNNPITMPTIPQARGYYGNPPVSESQGEYGAPDETVTTPSFTGFQSEPHNNQPTYHPAEKQKSGNGNEYTDSSDKYNKYPNHGSAPGSEPSVPGNSEAPYSPDQNLEIVPTAPTYQPDVLDYGARPNNHIGKIPTSPRSGQPPTDGEWNYSNSNNALSPRDPYDHFGTASQHPTLAPPQPSSHFKHMSRGNFEEDPEDGMDSGYGNNDVVIVPLRSLHSTTTTTNTEVRAQISEIDRIAESFENSAREPVEYDQKITSESSKGITVEAGKDIYKHLGRKSRKCCSCCDEKQPVSRNIETKVEQLHVQQAVDPSRQLGERDPVQNYVTLETTVGGSAYVQQPAAPYSPPQQTSYQQPFQQYQPQYPQSYPSQQPSCGCQPQPQNCCAPPAPCCLPTIPCCPPIPCCPQPKICCQPTPVCLPPQQCCSINFKLPTIPVCGRACPSCPCRRRVHKSRRLKRHAISSNCHQCSVAGEPWRTVLHHRQKRAAPGCSSGFSTMQQNSCGTCGASHLRSTRVKRMGCLPCLGRKKRDTEENSHIRVKRMGCLPCLGRKKRSALGSSGSGCSQCNSLGHLFNRYKRSLFGCSPCAPQPTCGCQGRKKRSVTLKIVKRAPEKCDASCCDYSRCLNRQKKDTLVPFM